MSRNRTYTPIDERTMMEKVSSGDVRALDCGDVTGAASTAAGFAGAVAGKAIPGLDVATVALSGVQGEVEGTKEYSRISQRFGDLRQAARRNRSFRRKSHELDSRWRDSATDAGVSALGSIGGASAGATIGAAFGSVSIPIPIVGTISGAGIGFFLGSIGGGIAANKIYTSTCVKQAQDPVTINEQICKMYDAGEKIPAELVYAALAANLSGKAGKQADKLLKKYTGTPYFTEALAKPENFPRITAMMNDQGVRTAIRAQTCMPRDLQNPSKSVAEQYAELINSGRMDPRAVLMPGSGMMSLKSAQPIASVSVPKVPVTPAMDRVISRSV